MGINSYPNYIKITVGIGAITLCGILAFYFTTKAPENNEPVEKSKHVIIEKLPMVVSDGFNQGKSDPQKLSIYSNDQWCQTGPNNFGIGLSWDDLIESVLIHLGTVKNNIDRELTVYFIGVNSEEGTRMSKYLAEESEALGYRMVGNETFDYRISDFYKPLRATIAAHPDALVFYHPYPNGDRLLEQIAKLELTSDMDVISLSQGINRAKVQELGNGLKGLKIAGGKDKAELLKAINEALAKSLIGAGHEDSTITAAELSTKLLALQIPSPFGELRFSPENYLLEQPIEILKWDGGKFELAEDSGFARHRGRCDEPTKDAAARHDMPPSS